MSNRNKVRSRFQHNSNKPIELNKTYKVALLDSLVAGGDGYAMLLNKKIIKTGKSIDTLLVDFLTKNSLDNYDFSSRITILK